MNEEKLQWVKKKLHDYVQVGHAFGVPVRISEANSISDGGEPFVSNTFAAALWTAELAFEFLQRLGQ